MAVAAAVAVAVPVVAVPLAVPLVVSACSECPLRSCGWRGVLLGVATTTGATASMSSPSADTSPADVTERHESCFSIGARDPDCRRCEPPRRGACDTSAPDMLPRVLPLPPLGTSTPRMPARRMLMTCRTRFVGWTPAICRCSARIESTNVWVRRRSARLPCVRRIDSLCALLRRAAAVGRGGRSEPVVLLGLSPAAGPGAGDGAGDPTAAGCGVVVSMGGASALCGLPVSPDGACWTPLAAAATAASPAAVPDAASSAAAAEPSPAGAAASPVIGSTDPIRPLSSSSWSMVGKPALEWRLRKDFTVGRLWCDDPCVLTVPSLAFMSPSAPVRLLRV